eukprot:11924041-Alexandrium_andersonii.AAC.1
MPGRRGSPLCASHVGVGGVALALGRCGKRHPPTQGHDVRVGWVVVPALGPVAASVAPPHSRAPCVVRVGERCRAPALSGVE